MWENVLGYVITISCFVISLCNSDWLIQAQCVPSVTV